VTSVPKRVYDGMPRAEVTHAQEHRVAVRAQEHAGDL
jgi:hypothetical protein